MEVVTSLSQGRTAAAQSGLFTHKSVPVIFEPPCISTLSHKRYDFRGKKFIEHKGCSDIVSSFCLKYFSEREIITMYIGIRV